MKYQVVVNDIGTFPLLADYDLALTLAQFLRDKRNLKAELMTLEETRRKREVTQAIQAVRGVPDKQNLLYYLGIQ